jgi:GNAT superfamily N-acetyltransferase
VTATPNDLQSTPQTARGGLTIDDFTTADIDDAAALLARRHARHLAAESLLSQRFTEPAECRALLKPYVDEDATSGAVARRDGQMVGFVLGSRKSDETWGANVWIDPECHALAADEPVETARDLYAHAAARWVADGRTAHYAVVPSHDTALVDAYFRLSFGIQHVYAVQGARPVEPPPEHLQLRLADRADIPALAKIALALPEHQDRSPVFSSGGVPTLEETVAEWEDDFDDPDFRTVVVEHDDVVVGAAVLCDLSKSSMHQGIARLDDAGFLGFAAVLPEARGLGAGRVLGEAAIGWAAERGYRSVVTDYRATNLLSSRTWPKLGWRPTYYRLHRLIGY